MRMLAKHSKNRLTKQLNHDRITALWPHGQAVKTSPFHGEIMGSSPVGVTKTKQFELFSSCFFFLSFFGIERLVGSFHND